MSRAAPRPVLPWAWMLLLLMGAQIGISFRCETAGQHLDKDGAAVRHEHRQRERPVDGLRADGAVVIDVGINRTEDGKLTGDVDFEGAQGRASAITPVPGGVGPMTIAMLLSNAVRAAELRRGKS